MSPAGAVSAVVSAATLPLRLSLAVTRTTLALGHLSDPEGPILRPGGYGERLDLLRDLFDPERPLGRLLEQDGVLDRLLANDGPIRRLAEQGGALERILAEDGPIDRLLSEDGPLMRLTMAGGAIDRLLADEGPGGTLDRLTAPGGVLDRVLAPGGLADRMLTDDGFVEKLVAEGGTLDQLIELGETLESIRPRLVELAELIPDLRGSVDSLGRSVEPLGELAGRLPLSRRRSLPAGSGPA
jgi:hypothetical protein